MAIEDDIAQLKREVTARQQDKARADHEVTQAEARQAAVLAALQEEFGATDVEQGRAVAVELEAALARDAGRARELLAQSGGQA